MGEPAPLTTDQCWRLLPEHGLGRVGFDVGRGPRIHPMNYVVDGQTIVLRTSGDSELELFTRLFTSGSLVAFEVDDLDTEQHEGWSVLIGGRVAPVDRQEELDRLSRMPRPWAGGERDHVVRITPVEVTGRRIGHEEGRQRAR
jgi:uncharacterized protein